MQLTRLSTHSTQSLSRFGPPCSSSPGSESRPGLQIGGSFATTVRSAFPVRSSNAAMTSMSTCTTSTKRRIPPSGASITLMLFRLRLCLLCLLCTYRSKFGSMFTTHRLRSSYETTKKTMLTLILVKLQVPFPSMPLKTIMS